MDSARERGAKGCQQDCELPRLETKSH
jgi:hypothetical protein